MRFFRHNFLITLSYLDQRLEDARAHEQAEDFARQEKILKLISTELTRNTTRVVEMAVKNEVQNSVLPSLESITKNEVKAALNDQVGKGLVDKITQVSKHVFGRLHPGLILNSGPPHRDGKASFQARHLQSLGPPSSNESHSGY